MTLSVAQVQLVKQKLGQAKMLKEARQDLTLEAIADAVGAHPNTIWKIDAGYCYVHVEAPKTASCPCCGRALED